jgi:hypothetical protein
MRDELLNESLFLDLDQARQIFSTRRGRIPRSVTKRRQHMPIISPQPAIALRYVMAPRASGCSHRAEGRINSRGSNRRWMKVQWQVTLRCNGTVPNPISQPAPNSGSISPCAKNQPCNTTVQITIPQYEFSTTLFRNLARSSCVIVFTPRKRFETAALPALSRTFR